MILHERDLGGPMSDPSHHETVEPAEGAPSHAAVPDTASDQAPGALTPDQVKLALRKVKDPELNLNIVDLGLVYDVVVDDRTVIVNMSLTSPGCPAGPEIMTEA